MGFWDVLKNIVTFGAYGRAKRKSEVSSIKGEVIGEVKKEPSKEEITVKESIGGIDVPKPKVEKPTDEELKAIRELEPPKQGAQILIEQKKRELLQRRAIRYRDVPVFTPDKFANLLTGRDEVYSQWYDNSDIITSTKYDVYRHLLKQAIKDPVMLQQIYQSGFLDNYIVGFTRIVLKDTKTNFTRTVITQSVGLTPKRAEESGYPEILRHQRFASSTEIVNFIYNRTNAFTTIYDHSGEFVFYDKNRQVIITAEVQFQYA